MARLALLSGLGWALLGVSACRRSVHEPAPPVDIAPSVELAPGSVGEGEPVALTYRWRTGPGFGRTARDYHAFVHLVDDEGATLLTDDHDPVPGTSVWEPSREYAYSRVLFAPSFYRLRLRVRVGLFIEGERLALRGSEAGRHEYDVAAFSVATGSPEVEPLRFGAGWALHSGADDPLRPMRWMLRRAGTVLLQNPHEDSLLVFEATVAPTRVGNWPVVDVTIGPSTWSLPLREREVRVLKLHVPKAAWGDAASTPVRLALGSEVAASGSEPFGAGEGLAVRGLGVLPMAAAPAELAAGAAQPGDARSAQ